MTKEPFPLSMGDITPGPQFLRMPMPLSPKGLPEGVHTGGPFSDGHEVWKPLDALPNPIATYRVRTLEAEILEEMSVHFPTLFFKNWRVEERNTRRFLVRPLLRVAPTSYPSTRITREHVLQVEQMVRSVNEFWWWINDPLNIAFDDRNRPVLLDLSSAQRANPTDEGNELPDETNEFEEWASLVAGDVMLVRLRRAARHLVSSVKWIRNERAAGRNETRRWVYAAFRMHLQPDECTIPDSFISPVENADLGVLSWCIVPEPLNVVTMQAYGLKLGWGPLRYSAGPKNHLQ